MLKTLEWLAKYGFIDIIFGIGVVGFIARLVAKAFPSNYDHLHVHVSRGGPVSIPRAGQLNHSLSILIRNAGQTNFYIARAYFRAKQRSWKTLWLVRHKTDLTVHPEAYRITDKDAFELKFPCNSSTGFTDYETLVRPGPSNNGVTTWLPLTDEVSQDDIDNRTCGVLYIEYATSGKQGVHVVKV